MNNVHSTVYGWISLSFNLQDLDSVPYQLSKWHINYNISSLGYEWNWKLMQHWDMPEPTQLAPFYVMEQWIYTELPVEVSVFHPLSPANIRRKPILADSIHDLIFWVCIQISGHGHKGGLHWRHDADAEPTCLSDSCSILPSFMIRATRHSNSFTLGSSSPTTQIEQSTILHLRTVPVATGGHVLMTPTEPYHLQTAILWDSWSRHTTYHGCTLRFCPWIS